MSEQLFHGSCHCGQVEFDVNGGFGVVICHCQDCQKLHGNAFAMIVISPDQLTLKSNDSVQLYRSSETIQRSFCKNCGSRLFKQPDDGQKMMISIGLLGKETGLKIRKQVWTESKPDWYDLPETVE